MGKITLTRWRKHGHDRLYVRDGGQQVGYYDLLSGRPEGGPLWQAEHEAAVTRWLSAAGQGPTEPARSGAQRRRGEDGAEPAAGRDLARNRAGSSAREAARERATWWRQLGRSLGLRTADQAWRIGAEGEELVAGTLRWARPFGWRALHSVPVGDRGSDIDHVLIGPAGVITLNTKHHRGQRVRVKSDVVFVGKTAKKYGQVSQYEAARATRLLSDATGRRVEVRAAVVVVGARSVRGSRSAGVDVMPKSHLLVWLLLRRRVLSRDEVKGLYEVARRSETWQ